MDEQRTVIEIALPSLIALVTSFFLFRLSSNHSLYQLKIDKHQNLLTHLQKFEDKFITTFQTNKGIDTLIEFNNELLNIWNATQLYLENEIESETQNQIFDNSILFFTVQKTGFIGVQNDLLYKRVRNRFGQLTSAIRYKYNLSDTKDHNSPDQILFWIQNIFNKIIYYFESTNSKSK